MGATQATVSGWQAIPWQAIAVVVASLVTGTVAMVGIIVSQGSKTRERIDALSASLGARVDHLQTDLEGTRRDVALLGQRVGTLPARVVDEDDCRERHDSLASLTLAQGRRLIVTGSGGQE
jgi:outer membrane murein-binding lipoprotein Lpp